MPAEEALEAKDGQSATVVGSPDSPVDTKQSTSASAINGEAEPGSGAGDNLVDSGFDGASQKKRSGHPSPEAEAMLAASNTRDAASEGEDNDISKTAEEESCGELEPVGRKRSALTLEEEAQANGQAEELPQDDDPLSDPSNYRRYYQAIFTAFKTETEELPRYLEVASECVKEASEERIEPRERRSHFLRMALPKFVLYLMGRKDLEGDDAVNSFILEVMELCIQLIPKDIRELHNILSRILTPSLPIYIGTEESQKAKKSDREKTRLAKTNDAIRKALDSLIGKDALVVCSAVICDPQVSVLYYVNVNYFANKSGFGQIQERMPLIEAKALGLLKSMLKITLEPLDFLNKEYLAGYAPALQECVFERLLASNCGPLQSDEHDNFQFIAKGVNRILTEVLGEEQATKQLDKFRLDVGLKGFESENLERRLRGLKMIRGAVRRGMMANEKEKGTFSAFMQKALGKDDQKKKLKPIDPEFLIRWLKDNSVVERLFNDKSHPEEIKQSILIPKFLASRQQFRTEDLESLWKLSQGKHESVQHTIFEALVDLAEDLPSPLLDRLYGLISSIPEDQIDIPTITFISRFSVVAMEKEEAEGKSYGLKELYRLGVKAPVACGGEGLNEKVVTTAFEHLVELLRSEACSGRRVGYAKQCAGWISKHDAVPQSIELLHKIVNMLPAKKRRGKQSSGSLIELLENSQQLSDQLVEDLRLYQESVKDVDIDTLQSSSKVKIGGRYRHIDHVKIRLNFLEVVLKHSAVQLSAEQANRLWDCLVGGSRLPEEQALLFQLLDSAREARHGGAAAITPEVIMHLFREKMCKIPVQNVTLSGYATWEKFFLFVNLKNGRLRVRDSDKKGGVENYYLFNGEPQGMEQLWKIALEVGDNEIARKAIRCMNTLYQFVPLESMRQRSTNLREAFIKQCMGHLASAVEGGATLQQARCLYLLRSLVESYDAKVKAFKKGPEQFQLKVRPASRHSDFVVSVSPNDTTTVLRQRISEKCCKPAHKLRVSIGQMEIVDSNRTLKDLKIDDSQILFLSNRIHDGQHLEKEDKFEDHLDEYNLRALLIETLQLQLQAVGLDPSVLFRLPELRRTIQQADEKLEVTVDHPSAILSRESNFQQLYDLLSAEGDIAKDAWVLLGKLDGGAALKDRLKDTTKLQMTLASFLDSKVMFKLAFSLTAIAEQARTAAATNDEVWLAAFLKAGAPATLVNTLMEVPIERSSGALACFGQILELLNLCFCTERDQRTAAGKRVSAGKWKPSVVRAAVSAGDELFAWLFNLMICCGDTTGLRFSASNSGASDGVATQVQYDEIVGEAMSFLGVVVEYNPPALDTALQLSIVGDWLSSLLLYCPITKLRHRFAEGLAQFCSRLASLKTRDSGHSPAQYLLLQLLNYLPSISGFPRTADKYFQLVECLLQQTDASFSVEWREKLAVSLCQQLVSHPVLESSGVVEAQDKGLVGLLSLLRCVCKGGSSLKQRCFSEGIVSFLLEGCLFAAPSATDHGLDAPPKCKTEASRSAAFRLIEELAKGEFKIYEAVTSWVIEHLKSVSPMRSKALVRGRARPGHGYVGLQNMGATCYMNSLLQQLYHIPEFRSALLSLEDKSEDLTDSTLYQMQVMFASLQESLLQFYHPGPFAASCKDFDGNPINPAQQQDANEFFNMLFDKLEGFFAGTEHDAFLKNVFSGLLANQFISQDCEHMSQNSEPFHTVGVEVKHKDTILESFDLFVEGEMLDEYHCEPCDKKVRAIKRCCLQRLPEVLVIQLKRFEFDLRNMSNVKLNDRLEFPVELNMEPYTVEGLARREGKEDIGEALHHPREHYEYVLRGIVVHTGTADSGHYYSFVQERTESGGWFEFNDADVVPWSISRLARSCFGGVEKVNKKDPQTGQMLTITRAIPNNAYILVYERKTYDLGRFPAPAGIVDVGDSRQCATGVQVDRSNSDHAVEPLEEEVKEPSEGDATAPAPVDQKRIGKAPVPDAIMDLVWQANKEFVNEQQIYNSNYFDFLWRIARLYVNIPEKEEPASDEHKAAGKEEKGNKGGKALEALPTLEGNDLNALLLSSELLIAFLVEVYSRSKDISLFPMWIHHARKVFSTYPQACRWLMRHASKEKKLITQMLMLSPLERSRASFSGLLEVALKTVAPLEREHYYDQYEMLQKKDATIAAEDVTSWVIMFVEALLSVMADARTAGKFSNAQYFLLLQNFALIGPAERRYLVHRRLIPKLVQFVLGIGRFQTAPKGSKAAKMQFMKGMGSRSGPVNIAHPCRLLGTLLRGCKPAKPSGAWKVAPPPTCLEGKLDSLREEEITLLWEGDFMAKLFRECHSESVTRDIVSHLCWEDAARTEEAIEVLRQGMGMANSQQLKLFLSTMTILQDMKDTLQQKRVSTTLEALLVLMEENIGHKKHDYCREAHHYLQARSKESLPVKQWCSRRSSRIAAVTSKIPPPVPLGGRRT